jgi:hypothetical protein
MDEDTSVVNQYYSAIAGGIFEEPVFGVVS